MTTRRMLAAMWCVLLCVAEGTADTDGAVILTGNALDYSREEEADGQRGDVYKGVVGYEGSNDDPSIGGGVCGAGEQALHEVFALLHVGGEDTPPIPLLRPPSRASGHASTKPRASGIPHPKGWILPDFSGAGWRPE